MEKEGKVKINIPKLILKMLYNILIIFCVILIAIIFMQKVTDSNGAVAGYRIFRVVTGSMVPKYDIGEVVICKETDSEDIKVGDSVVYRGRTGQLSGKIIMHEVIGKNYDENQNLTFHVKGLANEEEDPEVTTEQIFGVVKHKSPILTLLYSLATSIYSAFIIVTILVINVFISFKSNSKKAVIDDNKDEVKNLENNNEVNNDTINNEQVEEIKNEGENPPESEENINT